MKKVCILLIISLLVLGLAGMVSAGIEIGTGEHGGGEAGGIGEQEPEKPVTPGGTISDPPVPGPSDDPTPPGGGGEIGTSPEFSTFGIVAMGALGALSYFYIRRKKK
ncbi:MAG: hypothetical protein KAT43_05080 [Nanoarchaeota archaeon]|nr:hypothetical protein [Nanoarchaeota archaeon]